METQEMEDLLLMVRRIGVVQCESCKTHVRFADINSFMGSFICSECMRKAVKQPENSIELPT